MLFHRPLPMTPPSHPMHAGSAYPIASEGWVVKEVRALVSIAKALLLPFSLCHPGGMLMVQDETCSVLGSLALGVQLTMSRLGFGV